MDTACNKCLKYALLLIKLVINLVINPVIKISDNEMMLVYIVGYHQYHVLHLEKGQK